MQRRSFLVLAVLLILATLVPLAEAKVKLPSIISDNMVLQQGRPVTIWGWADPGEQITVRLSGPYSDQSIGDHWKGMQREARAKADAHGRWRVTLGSLEPEGQVTAGRLPLKGQWETMIITDSSGEETAVKNIRVGEVWLCSGQSNMEMRVIQSNDAKNEIAKAKYPKIRFFQVKNVTADEPQKECQGRWVVCSPETVGGCTAAGYFFARELLQDLKVPVGLIQSDWGGTPAEAWTSREALEAEPSLAPLLKRWDEAVGKNKKQARSPHRPANLYNAMIAPILPYTIRGALWYQGEANVGRAHQYRTIFPTMIADWRERFKQPDLPFGFVQIAPFRYTRKGNQNNVQWCAELWEAQLMTLKNTSNTGMAVTTDIGDLKNIHPTNKQEVGRRLALWALATVYGKNLVYSGPIYQSMKVEGNKIRLSFDHVGSGLASRDGKPLTHFTIAGADMEFHPAVATIDGRSIVVGSDAVEAPAAVRFAWHETAEPNLMNQEGLPASPFRTDDAKCLTEGKD
ncbi:MAG: 9-O-acetylesterase [Pirellulales bacterium]|nr:9-O-acetylesterase [Pirellulales bacterium]